MNKVSSCCTANSKQVEKEQVSGGKFTLASKIVIIVLTHVILGVIWWNLGHISDFITYKLLGIGINSSLGAAVSFFLKDMPYIFMLLGLIVFWMGILRTVLSPERMRKMLVGKNEFRGKIIAGLIGSITPFCSCSAVPLFIGMMQARIPLGVTFTYLITSPMINEVAFIMLWAIAGWQVALAYYVLGFIFAFVAGTVIGKLKMEKHVEPWIYEDKAEAQSSCGCGNGSKEEKKNTWATRITFARKESFTMIRKVGLYIFIGIAVGAGIHGYVPAPLFSHVMGTAWWAVPASVIVALPLYDNAGGVIPIVQALLAKGAAVGTVLSFMMGITAMSLPELMILKKVMRFKLLATFTVTLGIGIIIVGYIFNFLFYMGLVRVIH